jgi:hypothetical protein
MVLPSEIRPGRPEPNAEIITSTPQFSVSKKSAKGKLNLENIGVTVLLATQRRKVK